MPNPETITSLLTGRNLIAGQWTQGNGEAVHSRSRIDGSALPGGFAAADSGQVARAASEAADAFVSYAAKSGKERAAFLEAIASQIEALGDDLLHRAHHESGLPMARLTGERGRTCGQLRMFAQLIAEGSWVDARIERADANRTPPKPDIRRMLVSLGPVVVFGASNFPLAFSTAGGDTASALAAGCPVIFKAHPAHPGTCELVAQAIAKAAEGTGMPQGVFSMLHGGSEVGQALVVREEIEAVAFTGSQRAGRALFDLAAARPRPIPVFAEMGSVNPIFALPGAIAERGEALAKGYADSLTLGVGQFCTNPGVLVGLAGPEFDGLVSKIAGHLEGVSPGIMLTEGICEHYERGKSSWAAHSALTPIFAVKSDPDRAAPALFATSGTEFLKHSELAEEVFGPGALAVACESFEQMEDVAAVLKGQLTATLQMAEQDKAEARRLLPIVTQMAGRVLVNGFPTGVEVNSAMQHGGPYPATTDSRSTSVGTAAILRFARPVAFQSLPEDMLPPELQDSNPLGIRRHVNGEAG